jgi:hypothetical protein
VRLQVEKGIKKRRGGRQSNTAPLPPWLDRAIALLNTMDGGKSAPKYSLPRSRAFDETSREETGGRGERRVHAEGTSPDKQKPPSAVKAEVKEETTAKQDVRRQGKKLPRVILKVGPSSKQMTFIPQHEVELCS